MKKLWRIIFLGILLIVCLTGCDNAKEAESQEEDVQDEEFVVSIQEDSLSSTGLVLIMENESDDCAFSFGEAYALEKQEDGNWEEIEPIREVAVIAIEYNVLPGESVEHTVNWDTKYGSLPEGDYRLVKQIEKRMDDGEDYNDSVGDFYIYVSFSI